jgi:hypothetical protein
MEQAKLLMRAIGDYHVYDVLARRALRPQSSMRSAAEAYRKALALAPAGSERR